MICWQSTHFIQSIVISATVTAVLGSWKLAILYSLTRHLIEAHYLRGRPSIDLALRVKSCLCLIKIHFCTCMDILEIWKCYKSHIVHIGLPVRPRHDAILRRRKAKWHDNQTKTKGNPRMRMFPWDKPQKQRFRIAWNRLSWTCTDFFYTLLITASIFKWNNKILFIQIWEQWGKV